MEPNSDSLDFGKKLLELRTKKRMSQADVAKALKIGQTTYAGYENGKRNATTSVVKMLSRFFAVSPDYLLGVSTSKSARPPHYEDLTDDFRALVDNAAESAYRIQTKIFNEALATCQPNAMPDNVVPFRLSDQQASAGRGMYLGPDSFSIIHICDREGIINPNTMFGVPVSGDSMEPEYHDGDILIVEQADAVDPGDIGVFTIGSEGFVKKMGNGELISLNPKYDPIKIPNPNDEFFRPNGRVIGVLNPDQIVENAD